MCPSNDTFEKNLKKNSMLVLGLQSKDRKFTKDKANISNYVRGLAIYHYDEHIRHPDPLTWNDRWEEQARLHLIVWHWT